MAAAQDHRAYLDALLRESERRARERQSVNWCPHEPTPKQAQFLALENEEALYGGAAGGGKMLSLDTPIPTPDGWTSMGDLRVGDRVFDEKGQPCSVTHVHPVDPSPQSYRMVFDDGAEVLACAEHRWLTFDARELEALTRRAPEFRARRQAKRGSRATGNRTEAFTAAVTARNRRLRPQTKPPPEGTVRTTSEIAETVTTPRGRRNHAVPVARPLQAPEADLPLDPYILGLWLGDGHSRCGAITTADEDVLRAFHAHGLETRKRTGEKYTHTVYGLSPALREMGLLRNKHVPREYLRASQDQRLALLQGLMDTDGYCRDTGGAEFTSTTRELAESVHELSVGLGSKASMREERATLNGRDCGPKYRVTFSSSLPLFRLNRKLERQNCDNRRRTTAFRYIVSCEPVDPVPMRCISVDSPSRLYLCGRNMVPTHNSDALLMDALQHVDVPGYAALLLRRTNPQLEQPDGLVSRAHEWLAPTSAEWSAARTEYRFPSGARIRFGHMQYEKDKYNYQGGQYQYVGFDELTQFSETQYVYLHSRLRRLRGHQVPIKMRGATNPGGIGGKWVKRRFVDPGDPERPFIPALLSENPYLDQEAYRRALAKLDPTTRAQLERGDWIDDSEQLIYRVQPPNLIRALPGELLKGMVHVMAIDAGASLRSPTTAFWIGGWHPRMEHASWSLEAWSEAGLIPSDYADRIRDVQERYGELDCVVLDEGALGKGYGEELRRRHRLPVVAAKKQNKRAYRKLLNGDLWGQRHYILEPTCEPLVEEAQSLVFDDRGLDEAPGQENHLTDAWLYGWRRCYSWTSEAPETRPDPGSREALEAQAEAELDQERAAYKRQRERPWWQRR